jgi:adenine-specific DNA-methyltransferase
VNARGAALDAETLARLRELFPEAFGDDGVDVEVLKQLLDGQAAPREERFGLDWCGKRRAVQLALTPAVGALRPVPEESVAWETTRHLVIEGDNLEALKLLQASYTGRVKLIYIDPPYNTGNGFVYADDFRTGGRGGEGEAAERFHTAWLNMMYPRLRLARSLLRPDGVIFVSIDDNEHHHLRLVLDEIFGADGFVATFVWRRRTGAMHAPTGVSTDHEYVVCYSRSAVALNGMPRTFEKYSNPDGDPRGPWLADNLSAAKPGGDTYYPIRDPATGFEYYPPAGRFWPYSRTTMSAKIAEGRILFPGRPDGAPQLKRFRNEARSITRPISTWMMPPGAKSAARTTGRTLRAGLTSEGTRVIKELFGEKAFSYAKPLSLVRTLVQQATEAGSGDIVLDFFAGSGTTAHAVWAENLADGGNRRVILVQRPEPLSPAVEGQKIAARVCDALGRPRTIAELTKERLRRAGAQLRAEAPEYRGDLGFRVFKLDGGRP